MSGAEMEIYPTQEGQDREGAERVRKRKLGTCRKATARGVHV